ncbi:MAG: phosphoserine phosphatase SerB [Salinivirgaceae bacterium]|jgi:phosphoserine phosphatase|nr:phosphoserine phosphatase SerB [Salinivirgaceae bacterium]
MQKKREIILINISGGDKAGLTAQLTQILAQNNVNILDIGQAVIHEDLGLGILFEVPSSSESSPILKDLLFKAYELDIHIKFTPIEECKYQEWVTHQGKDRYIVTLLSRKLTAKHLAGVTGIIAQQGLNIDFISRLSGRVRLNEINKIQNSKAVVEFSVRGTPKNHDQMKKDFISLARDIDIDIAFQEDNIYRRSRRLICFDMDSTLIQTEVIDELAFKAGVGEKVSAITEAAMRGDIDFDESFRQRVALLKGLDEKVMKEIADNLPITEGAERLFSTLKQYGYKTAILSGGFSYFGNLLKNKLNIDYVFANDLEIKDGKLTGKHKGEIVNGEKKAELLKLLAFKEDIHLQQVIAVGDGSNDLPMLKLAGLGIAFHAKPKVKATAKHAISNIGLDAILYLLGFRDRDMQE